MTLLSGPMAPSKRKASKTSEKEVKKAKVVEDPIETAVKKLSAAINFDLAQELPHKVVIMVLAVIPDALSSTVEERDPIESEFAKLVGVALEQAQQCLDAKQVVTEATLGAKQAEVAELAEKIVKANDVKTECDSELESATTAEFEAKAAKNTAINSLTAQQEEEAKLPEQKEKLEEERAEIDFALGVTNGDVPSAKDSKKLAATLTKVGAPEALVQGVPAAVGKTGDLEKMFISEACKILEAKLAEVQGQQADWEKHTEEMAAKTAELDTEMNTLTSEHDEREKELKECKANVKAAAQGIKDAENAKKRGDKSLEKANSANEEALNACADCRGFYVTYEFLALRSSAPPPEEPEVPAEAPVFEEEAPEEAAIEEAAVEAAPVEETTELPPAELTTEGDVVSKMDVDIPEAAAPAQAADVFAVGEAF